MKVWDRAVIQLVTPLSAVRHESVEFMLYIMQNALNLQQEEHSCKILYIYLNNVFRGLSGRVLDSRPRGRGFEPHQRDCVVCLFDLILYVHSTIFQLCGTGLPGLNQY